MGASTSRGSGWTTSRSAGHRPRPTAARWRAGSPPRSSTPSRSRATRSSSWPTTPRGGWYRLPLQPPAWTRRRSTGRSRERPSRTAIGTTADVVAAIVTYHDGTQLVTQYAPYTLTVNGVTQPGGREVTPSLVALARGRPGTGRPHAFPARLTWEDVAGGSSGDDRVPHRDRLDRGHRGPGRPLLGRPDPAVAASLLDRRPRGRPDADGGRPRTRPPQEGRRDGERRSSASSTGSWPS